MPFIDVVERIYVPDGYKLKFGHRTVPQLEDLIIKLDGSVGIAQPRHMHNTAFVVEKAWEWPDWLKSNYIAMDQSKAWYAYMVKPTIYAGTRYWMPSPDEPEDAIELTRVTDVSIKIRSHLGIPKEITFPSIANWTQSLIKNPNSKE